MANITPPSGPYTYQFRQVLMKPLRLSWLVFKCVQWAQMYPKVLLRLPDSIGRANITNGELSSTLTTYENTEIQEEHGKKPFGFWRPHAMSGPRWQHQIYQHVSYSHSHLPLSPFDPIYSNRAYKCSSYGTIASCSTMEVLESAALPDGQYEVDVSERLAETATATSCAEQCHQ